MSRSLISGVVVALAVIATIVFVGVALTELNYAFEHPFRYGPAKVIAWAAGAGALLSAAVLLQAFSTTRRDDS